MHIQDQYIDRYLIEACKKGNKPAQKKVFDHYVSGMLAVCKRYVRNDHDAEELLLNGFYKFFANLGGFEYKDERSTAAWLKKIVVNECLMFLRKGDKLTFVAEEFAGEVMLNETVFGGMNVNQLRKLIDTLPDGYRIVFNMYVIEGYDHREIGRALGVSESTSRSQLARAKVMLQKLLKENDIVYEQ